MGLTFWISLFGIPSIISGTIMMIINRHHKKSEDKAEKRAKEAETRAIANAEARKMESLLIMRNAMATNSAIKRLAEAIKTGNCNGKVAKAIIHLENVDHEIDDYLVKQNATNNHGRV